MQRKTKLILKLIAYILGIAFFISVFTYALTTDNIYTEKDGHQYKRTNYTIVHLEGCNYISHNKN